MKTSIAGPTSGAARRGQPPARPKPFLLWRALMLRSIARLLIWIVKTLRL
jgi:hypothetical protein